MNAEIHTYIKAVRTALLLVLISSILSPLSGSVSFSVDAGSAGLLPDDIHNPGPIVILPGGGPIEVNAISYGHSIFNETPVYFSVDRVSAGAPGTAVFVESSVPGDQSADIFVSALTGTNAQLWDGDGVPAPPPLGLVEGFSDDLDGLDMRAAPLVGIFWSVDPASAGAYGAGATSADIWFSPPVPGYSLAPALFAPAPALGLAPTDDIDALVVLDHDGNTGWTPGDFILFSLAPGSPTLAGLGATPADILTVGFGGTPVVFAPAGALGLLPTDNLNALDVAVPEPATLSLIVGLIIFFGRVLHRRMMR